MSKNDVGAAILFVGSFRFTEGYNALLRKLTTADVEYIPFGLPVQRELVTAEFAIDLYETYEDVLFGIGEKGFANGAMEGRTFTDPP